MSAKKRALKVSVAPDGTITAETIGFTGSTCLSQIGALEDALEPLRRWADTPGSVVDAR